MRTALLCLGFALPFALASAGAALDEPENVDLVVDVSEVRAAGGAIEATLTNRSPRPIRDVRLLIEYVYHWPDEMHPGDESPGRSWPHLFPGPIAPGASAPLRFEPPGGLPTAPGRFEPRLKLLGFTEEL